MHDLRHSPLYPRIKEAYTETVRILEGTRRAGSYKQWVLQGRGPYKKLLRLRSQVARGYATIGRGKAPVVARLFGLPACRTRASGSSSSTRGWAIGGGRKEEMLFLQSPYASSTSSNSPSGLFKEFTASANRGASRRSTRR